MPLAPLRSSLSTRARGRHEHPLPREEPLLRVPRKEDDDLELHRLLRRWLPEPGSPVRPRQAGLLAHALRPDDDVPELEPDVRERPDELLVEPPGPGVPLPLPLDPRDLVDAVLREGREEPGDVPGILGDGMLLPEATDLVVRHGIRGCLDELAGIRGLHEVLPGPFLLRVRATGLTMWGRYLGGYLGFPESSTTLNRAEVSNGLEPTCRLERWSSSACSQPPWLRSRQPGPEPRRRTMPLPPRRPCRGRPAARPARTSTPPWSPGSPGMPASRAA